MTPRCCQWEDLTDLTTIWGQLCPHTHTFMSSAGSHGGENETHVERHVENIVTCKSVKIDIAIESGSNLI